MIEKLSIEVSAGQKLCKNSVQIRNFPSQKQGFQYPDHAPNFKPMLLGQLSPGRFIDEDRLYLKFLRQNDRAEFADIETGIWPDIKQSRPILKASSADRTGQS